MLVIVNRSCCAAAAAQLCSCRAVEGLCSQCAAICTGAGYRAIYVFSQSAGPTDCAVYLVQGSGRGRTCSKDRMMEKSAIEQKFWASGRRMAVSAAVAAAFLAGIVIANETGHKAEALLCLVLFMLSSFCACFWFRNMITLEIGLLQGRARHERA